MTVPPGKSAVRVKRGYKDRLPRQAKLGEPLFVVDTDELFIGKGEGHTPVKIGQSDYEKWIALGNSGSLEDFYKLKAKPDWDESQW